MTLEPGDLGKEKFYQKAEKELEEHGINFVRVDRGRFGVKGYDEKTGKVEKVYIWLTPVRFRELDVEKKRQLRVLPNWESVNTVGNGWLREDKTNIFMQSRLVFEERRGRPKKGEKKK